MTESKDVRVKVTEVRGGGKPFRLVGDRDLLGSTEHVDLSVHNVKRVTLTQQTTLSGCYVRELRMYLKNGKTVEVNLFSEKKTKSTLVMKRKKSYD